MTPEEKAVFEAVRVYCDGITKDEERAGRLNLNAAYDAYQKSLTTPPAELPEAPSGRKWVRVEYDRDFAEWRRGDWLNHHVGTIGCESYISGFVDAGGFGWRIVDDPDADSLERIADELAAVSRSGDHADYAKRIRALIAASTEVTQ